MNEELDIQLNNKINNKLDFQNDSGSEENEICNEEDFEDNDNYIKLNYLKRIFL